MWLALRVDMDLPLNDEIHILQVLQSLLIPVTHPRRNTSCLVPSIVENLVSAFSVYYLPDLQLWKSAMMYSTSSSRFHQLLPYHMKVLWDFSSDQESEILIRFASLFFDGAYDVYLQISLGVWEPLLLFNVEKF